MIVIVVVVVAAVWEEILIAIIVVSTECHKIWVVLAICEEHIVRSAEVIRSIEIH